MRQRISKVVKMLLSAVFMMMSVVMPAWVTLEQCVALGKTEPVLLADGDDKTSILPNDWAQPSEDLNNSGIMKVLKLALNVLVYGLGVAATVGVVVAGVLYLTARDNEKQVKLAKKRLFEVIIGLAAWGVSFALLNWLIPGGLKLNS